MKAVRRPGSLISLNQHLLQTNGRQPARVCNCEEEQLLAIRRLMWSISTSTSGSRPFLLCLPLIGNHGDERTGRKAQDLPLWKPHGIVHAVFPLAWTPPAIQ